MTIGAPPDDAALARFGYRQELHRTMGRYASFAAGFSFISVLTTVFQFFGFGYGFAGPAFVWTWPAVFAGQLLVAACFAELSARFPLSGAIYQWSSRLSTPTFGWFAGWIMVIGQIVVVAAAALALQVVLPALWSGFQFTGGDPTPTSPTGAANAGLLGVMLLVLTTVVNVVDNRVLSVVNRIGVTAEIAGAVLIALLLLTHARHGLGVTVHTGTGTGSGGGGGAFGALMVGSFAAAYVLIGFDSAGEMSEETRSPRRTAPRTILTALAAAGVLGALLVYAGVLASPDLASDRMAGEGLGYVLTGSLGPGVGKALLADVAVAVFVATLAIQTAGTRMLFSMARDGVLPFSWRLAGVSARTGMPAVAAVVTGVAAAGLCLLNFLSPNAFIAIGTTCVAMVYLAYAMVTGPYLLQRLRGRIGAEEEKGATDERGGRLFSLGRFGVPVSALALLYGLAMTVNLAWPRAAVYDPSGGHWYFRWFTLLFLAGTLMAGATYQLLLRRRQRAGRRSGEADRSAVPAPAA